MKKRGGGGDGDCGSWMDTYGDMVTLLLCFFVLLYSMSTLDNEKFKIFVRSINPNISEEQIGINQEEGDYGIEDEIRLDPDDPEVDEVELLNQLVEQLDQLYEQMAEALNEAGVEGVTVSGGDGYTYIAFQDRTFFNPDDSRLTAQGEQVLQIFCEVIEPMREVISQIDIMAHTAQADPDQLNPVYNDRMLAAMRAGEVSAFIQNQGVIEPEKLVGISYGQFRPIDTNDTAEGRARNRRVELLLVHEGADVRSLNEYYEEFTSGANADRTIVTDGLPKQDGEGFVPLETGVTPEDDASMRAPVTAPAEGEVPEGGAQEAVNPPEGGELSEAGNLPEAGDVPDAGQTGVPDVGDLPDAGQAGAPDAGAAE